MTTQQAILAMKIGCKLKFDWMKKDQYFYIHNGRVFCNGAPLEFSTIPEFSEMYADSDNWYIV